MARLDLGNGKISKQASLIVDTICTSPNPNSHSPWYRKWGQATGLWYPHAAFRL